MKQLTLLETMHASLGNLRMHEQIVHRIAGEMENAIRYFELASGVQGNHGVTDSVAIESIPTLASPDKPRRRRHSGLSRVEIRRIPKRTVRKQEAVPLFDSKYASTSKTRPRRHISVAGRKRIAEAQKKRWVAYQEQKADAAGGKNPGRRIDAAGRKHIAEARRAKWDRTKHPGRPSKCLNHLLAVYGTPGDSFTVQDARKVLKRKVPAAFLKGSIYGMLNRAVKRGILTSDDAGVYTVQ